MLRQRTAWRLGIEEGVYETRKVLQRGIREELR